jgi:hypothetical protein
MAIIAITTSSSMSVNALRFMYCTLLMYLVIAVWHAPDFV